MTTNKKYLALTEKDLQRRSIVESCCSKHITQKEGGRVLGMSTRQFQRLMRSYRNQGEIGLIHGLRGESSNHKRDKEKEGQIIAIMNEEVYRDFGPTFLSEELKKRGIEISAESLRKLMIREGKWEGKKQRDMTIRNRRERRAMKGEMIQYDGTYHYFLEERLNEEFCLLVAIDDATGQLLQLEMGDNEGRESTVRFRTKYMLRYGVPESIYVDRFATYKVNHKKATNDKKLVTNFERCLRKLGCLLIKAGSPQAKGRVERANGTLQDRMVKKLRLDNISDLSEANTWMEKVYIPRHNDAYAKKATIQGNKHRQLTKKEKDTLKSIFSLESTRIVQLDYVIQYKNKYYQLQPTGVTKLYTKTKCVVQEMIDGQIQIIANSKIIPYKEINADLYKIDVAAKQRKARLEQETKRKYRVEIRKQKRAEERLLASKQKQIEHKVQKLVEKGKKLKIK